MTVPSKRAEHLSIGTLIVTLVFFAVTLILGKFSNFFSIYAASWMILGSALVWFVLLVQFHQRATAEREKLDVRQSADSESAIFEAEGEKASVFALAQKRLQTLEKWFLPLFSAIIAAYQIAMGLYLMQAGQGQSFLEPRRPLLCAVIMLAVAFISFLFSRYATGMASEKPWKPLRAGGSHLLAVAVLSFLLGVGLALAYFDITAVNTVIKWVIPAVMIVIGIETALNVILDIYRPRDKTRYSRAAFDSRLLGTINEPGGLFHTAAEAIDYQFGFKVSQTWFYRLLEKAILPLLLFAAVTFYLMTCVVVIGPEEQAVVEHFGNPLINPAKESSAKNVRLLEPGLALKWPWPIDIAYKYPTKKVSSLSIGYVPRIDPETGQKQREPLLWGKSHYKEEYNLLVATEQSPGSLADGAVPVSLVRAAVPVHYKIKDIYCFLYNHNNTEEILESICYRELTRFAAGSKIEVGIPGEQDKSPVHSLLGAGRAEAKQVLTERIQKAADQADLGVEIVFVGLQGIHPPPDVAKDYQDVIGAVQTKQALILDSHAHRNKVLSVLTGSVENADELYQLVLRYQEAQSSGDEEKSRKLAEKIDEAFASAEGTIFETLRTSQSYAFEQAALARADGLRFEGQLKAYYAAPAIFKKAQRLAAFEDSLENTRKYVVVADPNDSQVYIVDVTEKLTPSLYDISGLQESSEK